MNFLLNHSQPITILVQAFLAAILWTIFACAVRDMLRRRRKKYKHEYKFKSHNRGLQKHI